MAARIFESMLFWLMFLAGGACMTLCLLLPAFFEYQATHAQWLAAEQRTADLQHEVTMVARQIDRLEQDEAYLNRIAFEDLGIATPGTETLAVVPSEPVMPERRAPERNAERLALVNQIVQRYPLAWVFIRPDTRVIAMCASGLIILAALGLRRPGPRPGGSSANVSDARVSDIP